MKNDGRCGPQREYMKEKNYGRDNICTKIETTTSKQLKLNYHSGNPTVPQHNHHGPNRTQTA